MGKQPKLNVTQSPDSTFFFPNLKYLFPIKAFCSFLTLELWGNLADPIAASINLWHAQILNFSSYRNRPLHAAEEYMSLETYKDK